MTDTLGTIQRLNDQLRTTLHGGRIVMTRNVAALPTLEQRAIFIAVQAFDAFTFDNDPYGEHDFGRVEVNGEAYFWKIDYYTPDMAQGAEDPADPQTTRVLTIMHVNEY
jgi:hypothetical protein